MGEVWLGEDAENRTRVAVKHLLPDAAKHHEVVARFKREAYLLGRVESPYIARVNDFFDDETYGLVLVMEFIEGPSLAHILEERTLTIEEAVDLGVDLLRALKDLHAAKIVHRDLKPGNIMLKADGTVKVLDFGLARAGGSDRVGQDADLAQSPTLTYQATSAGVVLGTAAYMSPEQARGRAVDKRSDVWSFGCVLYECLTARQAFHGETVSDTIAAILKSDVDLRALPADTPPRLRELLARCLCKDPRDRLRDIGEARVALERPMPMRRRRRPSPTGARRS
jgi:serine/threonine protein kinase